LIVVAVPAAPPGTAAARAQAGWPASLESLVEGVPLADENGQATADGRRMYFLRRLPRDPLADVALPAAETWAVRSSDSPPGTWQPGADVFDVASRSDTTALDGSRHGDW
jgi:general secretion pathway protein G